MDPLNLKRFGESQYRVFVYLAAAAGGCLLGSLLCFLLSSFSSHGSEVSTVNSSIQVTSKQDWNDDNLGGKIQNITLKMKVMPSQGHGVIEYMNWTTTQSSDFKDLNSDLKDYNSSFHQYTKNTDMMFSTLIFNDQMVPVGDAPSKCVYVQWAPKGQQTKPKSFKPLANLPDCQFADKGTWNDNDPKIGVDVPNWIQQQDYFSCSPDKCEQKCLDKGGWWVYKQDSDQGVCFTYQVLDSICLVMENSVDTFGRESWKYKGGCYEQGPGKYSDGVPNSSYWFDAVRIEVRSSDDPYVTAVEVSGDSTEFGTNARPLSVLGVLLFIGFLISAGGFGFWYWKCNKQEGFAEMNQQMDSSLQKMLELSEVLRETCDESVNRAMENLVGESMQNFVELRDKEKKLNKKFENESPLINLNSKKYLSNYIPIHKRVDSIIKNRNQYIKTLQLEAEMRKRNQEEKACSFRPNNSRSKPRARPAEFSQKANSWLVKSQQRKEKLLKQQEASIVAECSHSPVISSYSKKLAEQRSATPVINRLYTPQKTTAANSSATFRPAINPKSSKINRPNSIFQRLYSLRKLPQTPSKPPLSKTPPPSHKSEYTINTSRGPIYQETQVSIISYTPEL